MLAAEGPEVHFYHQQNQQVLKSRPLLIIATLRLSAKSVVLPCPFNNNGFAITYLLERLTGEIAGQRSGTVGQRSEDFNPLR